jgi:hypothetical protein
MNDPENQVKTIGSISAPTEQIMIQSGNALIRKESNRVICDIEIAK